jgi:hypothetical protein
VDTLQEVHLHTEAAEILDHVEVTHQVDEVGIVLVAIHQEAEEATALVGQEEVLVVDVDTLQVVVVVHEEEAEVSILMLVNL